MTKLATGGAVLVLAIIFGFIFWNQFSSNQRQLAGDSSYTNNTYKPSASKADSLDLIEADLSSSNIDNIDSDSSQMEAKLK